MLDELVAKWKEQSHYKDVEAVYLNVPSDEQLAETCPSGCTLVIYGSEQGGPSWREMQDYPDHFRQTRICRAHGFARIYVTTGLSALGARCNLK